MTTGADASGATMRDEDEWPKDPSSHFAIAAEATSLKRAAIQALVEPEPLRKAAITRCAARRWFSGRIGIGLDVDLRPPDRPGRPARPELVPPAQTRKRSLRSPAGRIALLHAIAHIELNAMDLAWDIVARFASARERMPRSFYDGWCRVAYEEAKHFTLLHHRLADFGAGYGDLPAHDGLWEAAQATGHSLRARLAVVPLILEARGLDVTPSLLKQLRAIDDEETARIFEIIYRDEQGHVAVGAKWFRYLCLREGLEPAAAFQHLVRAHFRGPLKPPFNDPARSGAGLPPGFYRALSSAGT